MTENLNVLDFFYKYKNGFLFDGGINLLSIDKIMDYELIEFNDRPLFVRKLIIYSSIQINKSMNKGKVN